MGFWPKQREERQVVVVARLCESELGGDPEVQDEGNRLASDILSVLGISEYGEFVGREMLV